MALPPILPITTETYNDIWSKIDSNFLKSVESIEIPLAGVDANKIKLKLFDGTYLTGPVIPFPVTGANNGLSFLSGIVKLGGNLTGGTAINTGIYNFLIQNGTTAQRLWITNTFAELAGQLELRILPPSIGFGAVNGQFLKLLDSTTGRCDYDYIKSSDFTSLSIVGDKVRLTFKDASFIETAGLPAKSFGSFTKNNIATASAGAVNVFVLVAGATTAGTLIDFTHTSPGRLTYTGTVTKNFKITRVSSMQHNAGGGGGNNQDYQTRFYKNAVAIGVPNQERQITGQVLQNRTTITTVSLATGDYVEMYAANILTGANLLIENYCTCIIEEI